MGAKGTFFPGNVEKLNLMQAGEVGFTDSEPLLKEIHLKWTKLTRIRLCCSCVPQGQHEKLLISYEKQLRHVELGAEYVPHLLFSFFRIALHCPSLETRHISTPMLFTKTWT